MTTSAKYLRIYEINHSKNHQQKTYENESRKDTNFADFRRGNGTFKKKNQPRKNFIFQQRVVKKVRNLKIFSKIIPCLRKRL